MQIRHLEKIERPNYHDAYLYEYPNGSKVYLLNTGKNLLVIGIKDQASNNRDAVGETWEYDLITTDFIPLAQIVLDF